MNGIYRNGAASNFQVSGGLAHEMDRSASFDLSVRPSVRSCRTIELGLSLKQ